MALTLERKFFCCEGWVEYYSHLSSTTNTVMKFSVFRPPQAAVRKVPVLYWLSGLECTEETFMIKAGAQRWAAELGMMIVACDTSPRGAGVPGETDSWDFGVGAGFYVNATAAPWNKHYRMYDYVTRELRSLVEANLPVLADRAAIAGHSMGGHGALVIALREPDRYRSVSAFAPIAAPSLSPWGQKAFSHYLGPTEADWAPYDAHRLVATCRSKIPLLVDIGTEDRFLATQLFPEKLEEACRAAQHPLTLQRRSGYDHSYYFVSSFIGEHLAYHARALTL